MTSTRWEISNFFLSCYYFDVSSESTGRIGSSESSIDRAKSALRNCVFTSLKENFHRVWEHKHYDENAFFYKTISKIFSVIWKFRCLKIWLQWNFFADFDRANEGLSNELYKFQIHARTRTFLWTTRWCSKVPKIIFLPIFHQPSIRSSSKLKTNSRFLFSAQNCMQRLRNNVSRGSHMGRLMTPLALPEGPHDQSS